MRGTSLSERNESRLGRHCSRFLHTRPIHAARCSRNDHHLHSAGIGLPGVKHMGARSEAGIDAACLGLHGWRRIHGEHACHRTEPEAILPISFTAPAMPPFPYRYSSECHALETGNQSTRSIEIESGNIQFIGHGTCTNVACIRRSPTQQRLARNCGEEEGAAGNAQAGSQVLPWFSARCGESEVQPGHHAKRDAYARHTIGGVFQPLLAGQEGNGGE